VTGMGRRGRQRSCSRGRAEARTIGEPTERASRKRGQARRPRRRPAGRLAARVSYIPRLEARGWGLCQGISREVRIRSFAGELSCRAGGGRREPGEASGGACLGKRKGESVVSEREMREPELGFARWMGG
jgi:hypothetical protein